MGKRVPLEEDVDGVPNDYQVGVVLYVAGGGPEVDDAGCFGTDLNSLFPLFLMSRDLSKGVVVSHDIVFEVSLLVPDQGPVQALPLGLHLIDGLLGDLFQPELHLRLGQPDPELSPEDGLVLLGEDAHQGAPLTVAGGQHGLVLVLGVHLS